MSPNVSIVIPAFREGERLPAVLEVLGEQLAAHGCPPTEILVVDDGSPDEHADRERVAVERVAQRFATTRTPHSARYLSAGRNRGKGAAVRLGWKSAAPTSEWLGFVDADGSVPPQEISRMIGELGSVEGVDVYAGTRILMAGRTIRRSLLRHLQGRVFATLTEQLFRLGFYDTQCGLKFFRAAHLRSLLGELQEDRWLLDIEVLALLQQRGSRCIEVPVDWADPGGSKIIPVVDPFRMGIGLLRLRHRIGPARQIPTSLRSQ